jgi:creatinine amidohydrolase
MEVEWRHLTATALNERAGAGAIVLLPVASTEQHGPHMATGTDALLVAEVCRRVALRIDGVVAPTLWVGLAEHHMSFGGSFTLRLSTYQALLADLLASIRRAGFGRVVIVNGHGGNMTALNAMSAELSLGSGLELAVTTYFLLAEAAMAPHLEDQPGVLHAGEAETSMMLALRPESVDTARLAEATGPMPERGSALASPLHRWRSFAELSTTGVIGDARRATALKGEHLLEAAATALAEQLAAGEPWAQEQ